MGFGFIYVNFLLKNIKFLKNDYRKVFRTFYFNPNSENQKYVIYIILTLKLG